MSDHTKFRILHAGADLHHVHHQHAHQWLHSPDTPNGYYPDSQTIGPGSAFTLEMVYNGSGNLNQTVGDSIFHCHFYPHFAGGMWSLWRVHDVLETGTPLDADGRPVPGARALPDGEIAAGTPIPAVVPLPTLPMAPLPAVVRLTAGRHRSTRSATRRGRAASRRSPPPSSIPSSTGTPAIPSSSPASAASGRRIRRSTSRTRTRTISKSATLDGGLPRHLIRGCAVDGRLRHDAAAQRDRLQQDARERLGLRAPRGGDGGGAGRHGGPRPALPRHLHAGADSPSRRSSSSTACPPIAGAPYADPCINYSRGRRQARRAW